MQAPDGVGLDEDVKPGMVWVPGACCPWFPMEGANPHILWFQPHNTTSSGGHCKASRTLVALDVGLRCSADPMPS